VAAVLALMAAFALAGAWGAYMACYGALLAIVIAFMAVDAARSDRNV
jgi:hypothetical protein